MSESRGDWFYKQQQSSTLVIALLLDIHVLDADIEKVDSVTGHLLLTVTLSKINSLFQVVSPLSDTTIQIESE